MSLQPILISGLVLAALLYAVGALIFRQKGMRTERWYLFMGAALLSLALLVTSEFFNTQWPEVIVPPLAVAVSIVCALRWRPQTDEGRAH